MRTFSTVMLPGFVHDYLGRPVTMSKARERFSWTFTGSRMSMTVTGRTAASARARVADTIAAIDGRQDKRRRNR